MVHSYFPNFGGLCGRLSFSMCFRSCNYCLRVVFLCLETCLQNLFERHVLRIQRFPENGKTDSRNVSGMCISRFILPLLYDVARSESCLSSNEELESSREHVAAQKTTA